MREYIATLDDVAFGAASEVTPKFVSPSDPAAQREQVFDELYNLRVPGIASTMGKQEMLLRFVDWQAEHEDAIAGKSEQPIIETVVDGQLSRRNLKIAAPKNFSGSAFCCSLYAATPRDRLLRNGILWRRLSIGGGLDPDMLQFRR